MDDKCPVCDRPLMTMQEIGDVIAPESGQPAFYRQWSWPADRCGLPDLQIDDHALWCQVVGQLQKHCRAHAVDWRARAQAAEAKVAELEGLRFVVWNGTPSDKVRIWMLEGATALGEIEQVTGGWRWIWWGEAWHKAKTHIEARDALLARHAQIRAEQAAHASRGE